MAPLAEGIRPLAHHLHADSPLGWPGRPGEDFEAFQGQRLIAIRIECLGLDSTKHQGASRHHGCSQEGRRRSANPGAEFIWSPRIIKRR